MRKFLLFVVLFCLAAGVAQAQTVADSGRVLAPGFKKVVLVGGLGSDGATLLPLPVSGSGVLSTTESNPDYLINNPVTIVNVALTVGQANTPRPDLGTGLTPYPASAYAYTWWRVTTTNANPATACPWSVRWWGSTDGTTYQPVNAVAMGTTLSLPWQTSATNFFMTGNPLDTLKIQGRGNTTTGWLSFTDRKGVPVTLKNVIAVASLDSTSGTPSITITSEMMGRAH